jgi:hypothetical protein
MNTMSDDAPKSAIELAMARLRKKDEDAGDVQMTLTDAQRAAIADVRQVFAARRAQAEIMHQTALAGAMDVETLTRLNEEFRRDVDRMARETEEKIAAIHRGSSQP